jgi:hypothetical protein
MYLGPEEFIEQYQQDRLPYFKVHRGGSMSEKTCMLRLTELPDGMTKENTDAILAHGVEKLSAFFDRFPDGYVTILCKSAPKNNDGNVAYVKWGDGKNAGDMTRQNVGNASGGGGGYMNPSKQLEDTIRLVAAIKGAFGGNDNSTEKFYQMQMQMMERQFEERFKALKKDFQTQRRFEEYEAALQGEPPSVTDTLLTEAIGLIKPLATSWMMKQGGALPLAQLPVVNGMEATVPKPKKNGQSAVGSLPTQARPHPMVNMSMDRTLLCIRQIMEQVFPDYNVNEVMPALAQVSTQHKDIIRQFVAPQIEANRQAATAPKRAAAHNEEEE